MTRARPRQSPVKFQTETLPEKGAACFRRGARIAYRRAVVWTQLYSKSAYAEKPGVRSDAAPTSDWPGLFIDPQQSRSIGFCGPPLWGRGPWRTEGSRPPEMLPLFMCSDLHGCSSGAGPEAIVTPGEARPSSSAPFVLGVLRPPREAAGRRTAPLGV
jgi:hypothetical protein